jgi:2'-hydroxyisoflavone reductase
VRILVLGGSWFLGRAIAEAAAESGHEVTVFNRGRSGSDPAGVASIRGDRESAEDVARLAKSGPWDAVIDPSGQVPRVVLENARVLADQVSRYLFVSSVSAYTDWPIEPLSEGSAVLDCPPDADAAFGADDPRGYPTQYGFLKAGCERAVTEVFGGRALVLRPGVILGPYEYVGRLPWWLRRIQRGGQVVAPGDPARTIQPIDVRDVAQFALDTITAELEGIFNVAAPLSGRTFRALLEACRTVTGSNAELIWVKDEILLNQGVRQWTELPLWRTYPGTWQVSAAKATVYGLSCRPLEQTVADTWRWLSSGGASIGHERAAELGITPEKESTVLRAWQDSNSPG